VGALRHEMKQLFDAGVLAEDGDLLGMDIEKAQHIAKPAWDLSGRKREMLAVNKMEAVAIEQNFRWQNPVSAFGQEVAEMMGVEDAAVAVFPSNFSVTLRIGDWLVGGGLKSVVPEPGERGIAE